MVTVARATSATIEAHLNSGPPDGCAYGHVTWDQVAPLIRQAWPAGKVTGEQAVIDGLLDTLAGEPTEWRRLLVQPVAPSAAAMELAAKTADDGRQRALDYAAPDLEALLQLRADVRDSLAGGDASSPLRRVMPWLWRPQSKGTPRTAAGEELGYELRFSRYAKPMY